MRILGHTMAVPESDANAAVERLAAIGCDGVELVYQAGTAFSADMTLGAASKLAGHARDIGAPIMAITPYAWDINHANAEMACADLRELLLTITVASDMKARFVRAYSGREVVGAGRAASWGRAVNALRQAGDAAARAGITLLVENHMETLTRTGADTARLLRAVGSPAVRALYDPANVMYDTDETWDKALEAQRGLIDYVHIKDYALVDGQRHACVVGEGCVPWGKILPLLAADGVLFGSLEYERRWHPDQLPPAEVGLAQSLAFCREVLG